MPISVDDKRRAVQERHWHYRHDLGDGVFTVPWLEWLTTWHALRRGVIFERISEHLGPSLDGLSCLDIACNSGFWSFELVERGAARVLAFDIDRPVVENALFVRDCHEARTAYRRIEFRHDSLFTAALDPAGYDLVLCLGLMYHLTDPFGAARRIAQATNRLAIVDSSCSDLEGKVLEFANGAKYFFNGKDEFAFVPTREALIEIMRQAGFARVSPWRPEPDHPGYREYGPQGFRLLLVCEKSIAAP